MVPNFETKSLQIVPASDLSGSESCSPLSLFLPDPPMKIISFSVGDPVPVPSPPKVKRGPRAWFPGPSGG